MHGRGLGRLWGRSEVFAVRWGVDGIHWVPWSGLRVPDCEANKKISQLSAAKNFVSEDGFTVIATGLNESGEFPCPWHRWQNFHRHRPSVRRLAAGRLSGRGRLCRSQKRPRRCAPRAPPSRERVLLDWRWTPRSHRVAEVAPIPQPPAAFRSVGRRLLGWALLAVLLPGGVVLQLAPARGAGPELA